MRRLAPFLIALLASAAWLEAGASWEPRGGLDDPTPAEARGREVFRAEACFTCHGAASRAQATGLERPGPVRGEEWFLAHLLDPRRVHPHSPMPSSAHLFELPAWIDRDEVVALIERFDANGDGRVTFATDARRAWSEHQDDVARMADLDIAGVRVPPRAALQSRTGEELWPGAERPYVDRFVEGEEAGDGVLSLHDIRPRPTPGARDLARYLRAVAPPRDPRDDPPLDADAVRALVALGGRLQQRPRQDGAVRGRLHAPDPVPPAVLAEGARLFAAHCATCHGAAGRGDGPAAASFRAPPTDLRDGTFTYRSTLPGKPPLLTDLYRTIRRGLPGSGMPGLARATPRQVWALALHVRSLAGASPEAVASVVVPRLPTMPEDPAAYTTLVARGKALFVAFECSRCHGTEGRGDGPDAIAEWSDGRAVRARDFKPRDARDVPAWRMRGGASPQAIWRTIMTGLDAEGMPGVYAVFETARRAGSPQPIDARLVQPLKDPALFAVGVQASRDGPYEERLRTLHVGLDRSEPVYARFGDDWCLVLYVLHLMRTEDEVKRGVVPWPQTAEAK